MSYILDALRRAEAERERGQVPGLHARSSSEPDPAAAAGGRLRTWAPWAVAGVSVLVAAALAWTWRAAPGEQPATPVAVPSAAVAADTTPAPAVVPQRVAPMPSAAPPISAMAMVVPEPPTRQSPASRPSAPASTAPALTAMPAPVPTVAPPSAPDPAPAPAEHRVSSLAELPEATRRDIPALSIAGASYSEHAANRLLIVNGNVFHEGDRLAPDLVLERIDLKSAVLRYKDVRFSVSY